jgi:septum formation protein
MLLRQIGLTCSVVPSHADESFPADMPVTLVPALLAERKAATVFVEHPDSIVLASDTVVILGQVILNKPADRADAIRMIKLLSGETHTVITAVHLKGPGFADSFEDATRVTFRKLSPSSIEEYVDRFQPFDKAGAYGAQECLPAGFNPCSEEETRFLASIGKENLVAASMNNAKGQSHVEVIDRIDGSYFTVMGLPIHLVYRHLLPFNA